MTPSRNSCAVFRPSSSAALGPPNSFLAQPHIFLPIFPSPFIINGPNVASSGPTMGIPIQTFRHELSDLPAQLSSYAAHASPAMPSPENIFPSASVNPPPSPPPRLLNICPNAFDASDLSPPINPAAALEGL